MSAVNCTIEQLAAQPYVVDILIQCSRGALWSRLRDLATLTPWYLWSMLAGRLADPDQRLYFYFVANFVFLGWFGGLALRDIVLQQPPANPQCNNDDFAMPSIEAVLYTLYYGIAVMHHLYLRIPFLTLGWLFQFLFWFSFEWFVLVYTGQYSNGQFAAGMGVGIAFTLLLSFMMYVIIVPRFPFFANRGLIFLTGTPTISTRPFEKNVWKIL